MDMDEAIRRVKACGWVGVLVWDMQPKGFMACLFDQKEGVSFQTNLWDYAKTPNEALISIVEKAERNPQNVQDGLVNPD